MRTWVGTVISGLVVAGFGIWDAIWNHSVTLSAAGDSTYIIAGAGVIAGRAIFELGVQTPTPPKA